MKYSGNFENDVFSGNKGILCDEKGNVYEGDFVKGKYIKWIGITRKK